MASFAAVAELAEQLAGEASRLKKRAAIAQAISTLHAASPQSEDAGLFALYLSGLPFAEADVRKLNAGGSLLTKAVIAVSGANNVELTAAYRRHGDLGAAAFDLLQPSAKPATTPTPLTLAEVADAFAAMAVAKTTAIRVALVEGMLRRTTPLEAKYLLKLMLGDMRIGVKQSLVEEAIAEAAGSEVAAVRHAVMLEADLSRAVERAFAGTLAEARMTLFHPLGFMLASPVETPEEAFERFTAKPGKVAKPKPKKRRRKKDASELLPEDAAEEGLAEDVEAEAGSNPEGVQGTGVHALIEDKYDGIRAQVHCADAEQPGRVAIYSRNRENITESYPELEEAFAKVSDGGAGGLIFDGAILGWDVEAER